MKGYQQGTNMMKRKRATSNLPADSHNILEHWKN